MLQKVAFSVHASAWKAPMLTVTVSTSPKKKTTLKKNKNEQQLRRDGILSSIRPIFISSPFALRNLLTFIIAFIHVIILTTASKMTHHQVHPFKLIAEEKK